MSIELDPNLETADTDISNNAWPRKIVPTRFELYNRSKSRHSGAENPMKEAQKKQILDNFVLETTSISKFPSNK